MPLTINTNLASLGAQGAQQRTQSELATAIARLSSGLRINSAKDDAAGLAIADRFTAQVRGITQAGRNANDGISLAQTAEGALASIDANLQRIRELSVQSANATNSASDRASLQTEVAELQSEIDRVAVQTRFNGISLLDGSFTAKTFQVGANVGQTIAVASIASARSGALGVYQGFALANQNVGISGGPVNVTVTVGGGPAIPLGPVAPDAKAVAAAINAGAIAGLTASANPTTIFGASAAVAAAGVTGTAAFTLNGVAIGLQGTGGAAAQAGNRASAVAAINAQSAATGVVATDSGAGLNLTATDGRNITYSYAAGSFTGSFWNDFGLSPSSVGVNASSNTILGVPSIFNAGSTINLNYVAPRGTTGNVVVSQGAWFNSTGTIAATGTAVGALDISSVPGANAALSSIDAALDTVSSARAALGAVQNRFTSTIENLQTTGENLAASRSRIQDADFAMETANLSRAQVLQQAGTAMIAQANQGPRQALSLLR